ncbi:hypothetical protein CHS0354_011488 [Potamilus streckersoni]|uniref:CUB domain-containing protein n=1 Tax=Potamilus streckersoni TaxID=2493646 RepID=A0AAE0SL13_9BIVA|nr:hypothetical protein CHS0354_011488 [Potamilus streckersoni]
MSIFHFKTLYLLFFPGSFAFTNQDQFNFCWKKTVDNREKNQTLCCSSGRIKFEDLSYCKNETSVCASNAVCDASECCNGTDLHYFNSSQALAVYTVCSYETNCSINWEDKAFIPPRYQGHVNNIVNYTCIEESMVLKMCEDNVMTGGQVELVLDGKKPGVVSSGPAKCECSLLIESTNGSWSVDLTDLRFAKPSDSSCSTAMLNISGLSIGKCSAGQFQYKGTFMFNSGYSNKLSIEHLFEFGVEDIPSMIWITIRGNSNSITVNCSSIETIHNVTYYTYSTPRQATSSTHPTSFKKMTTQDDRKHFFATKTAETTSTTIAMGPVTNTTVSEISVQHGDSTLLTLNSRASQTIHNETSYSSQLQTTPSSLYMSWTKLPTTQDDRTSYSLSTVTDNTGKTGTDGMVSNTSVSETRGYSNSVKVNSSATQTVRSITYYSSLTLNQTTPSSSPMPWTTLPTTQDHSMFKVTETTNTQRTEGNQTLENVSEPWIRHADNDNVVLIIELVVPIIGGVFIIISLILAVICIRRRRKQKQHIRIDVEVESYGDSYHLFPPESTSNVRMNLHNYEDMGDSHNRDSCLFSDENINAPRSMVQEYDQITFEKLPRKRIPNYDLIMEGADIDPFDMTYSHLTSEPLSSKYSTADDYSHINFDKTRAMEQQNAKVNTKTKLRGTGSDLHFELETKSAFSNVNPTGKTEPTMNDCYTHPAIMQSADHVLGSHSNCRQRETILDGDSYNHADFNTKRSRDNKGVDMAFHIEKGSEDYNYAKVNREHNKRHLTDSM